MKGGAIVDATVISSNSSRPKGGEVSKTNPEAGWTKKAGTYHHGYKMHTCVDEEHGLVQGLEVTSADIHDSLAFGQLLYQDDSHVYADKACDTKRNVTLWVVMELKIAFYTKTIVVKRSLNGRSNLTSFGTNPGVVLEEPLPTSKANRDLVNAPTLVLRRTSNGLF